MEFREFVPDVDPLPIFYPSMSSPVVGIERGGVVLFEPWYSRLNPWFVFLENLMDKMDYLPAVNDVHLGDLLGDIVVELGEIGLTVSWPVSFVVALFVFKLKGWLIRGITRTVIG